MSLDLNNYNNIDNKVTLEVICKDMASGNWNKYWAPDALLIRPSGNPLTLEDNEKMRNNKDIIIKKEELVKINYINVYDNIANVCMTVHQVFNYKEVENDDISVVLLTLKREGNNKWMMISGSRSSGRSVNDPLPEFPN